jgi:RES domain
VTIAKIRWPKAVRIIRSRFPTIDLFEDIADPSDWPLLIAAEEKTNPRLADAIGALDLVPPKRRVGGPGASYLMAPFTHASPDRPSRFSAGLPGILYAGDSFEVALAETVFHHSVFMAKTRESPGWTSQFREIVLTVEARLHDLRAAPRNPSNYAEDQALGTKLRAAGSNGVVYRSVRWPQGECVGLFYPDCAQNAVQARHLEYHWDGSRVDLYRTLKADGTTRQLFRIIDET